MKKKKRGSSKKKSGKKRILLAVFLILVFASFVYLSCSLWSEMKLENKDKIVVIPIEGTIGESSSVLESGGVVNPKTIKSYIEKANKDENIKAIILDINSGGGTVTGSEIIADSVKKSQKPVVALIRDVGASGAYWIASASDKIVVYPMSVTGSIGVRGSYLEFAGLMDKYGVKYQSLTAGEYKDTGSPYKEISEEERAVLMDTINKIYDYFVEQVAVNRNMNKESVKKLATGQIFLGYEAKSLGLIDYVGDEELAINITKELANIKDAELVYYEEKISLLNILTQLSNDFSFNVGRGISSELMKVENNKLNIRV